MLACRAKQGIVRLASRTSEIVRVARREVEISTGCKSRRCGKVGLSAADLTTTFVFDLVHAGVCGADDGVDGVAVARRGGNADAGGDVERDSDLDLEVGGDEIAVEPLNQQERFR